ncbi:MAG: hypothetical protein LBG15_12495 [Dysgonamonadaceae bacterium]|jgi:hypothetical protein|nr:hypothetical protein [Dysgonamonadaceae bacterium]
MTKEKKIKLDVFLCNIHIIITDDPNKCVDNRRIRQYCSDSPDEDLSKNCDGIVFQKSKFDYYTILPPYAEYGSVCHESVHLIGRIFRDRGQIADYKNDEVFAYYVGWIAGEIYTYIKSVYKYFDAATK